MSLDWSIEDVENWEELENDERINLAIDNPEGVKEIQQRRQLIDEAIRRIEEDHKQRMERIRNQLDEK